MEPHSKEIFSFTGVLPVLGLGLTKREKAQSSFHSVVEITILYVYAKALPVYQSSILFEWCLGPKLTRCETFIGDKLVAIR